METLEIAPERLDKGRYTVANTGEVFPWAVLFDNQPVKSEYGSLICTPTRKAALAAIAIIVEILRHKNRLIREDLTGHVWTPEESKSIDKLAKWLIDDAPGGMFDRCGMRARSKSEHDEEAYTIETWYENALAEPWPEESQGNFICVELRCRRASRLEAYKRAGLTLNRDRYAAFYVGTDRSEVERPYASAYSTSQERDAAVTRFNEIAEKRGEIYEVSVVTIPPAWPTDCRFTLPE